jgi:hypothetical protein
MPQLTPSTLTELLRAGAPDRQTRAALDLLVWHESWIPRLAQLTGAPGSPVTVDEDLTVARLDWTSWLLHLDGEPYPYSTTELYVLHVAASIAGGTLVSLHSILGDGNGTATRRAIVEAITAAAGDLDARPWSPDDL